MSRRMHEATTSDGVTLRGSVHGEGPPVVFWHGAFGDGDLDWAAVLPYLADRFTCYLPGWRGRGRSDDHPDLGYGRRVADLVAYVESLGEPTGLVGWSGSGNPALAAAARTGALNALALYEPTMGAVMDDQDRTAFGGAVARMRELAADDLPSQALRAGAAWPFNDAEIAAVADAGYFEQAGRYVPNLLDVFAQLAQWDGPTADDPAVLGAITAPVLVMHGQWAKPFWVRGAQHVADHVPYAGTQVIPAAGHAGPLTHPEAVAEALAGFFSPSPTVA